MLIMDIVELRTDLHNMIDKISDSNVLNAVKTLLAGKAAAQEDWWDEVSEEDRKAIEEGLEQLDRGEYLTRSEVREKIQEKYKL
ncbi:MAG: hypothetical protein CSA96_03000 [Bacteroidetes bacterium]|nr:MAG: hypothetical protein CSA96_03000 [Bacteroidota bacterium]